MVLEPNPPSISSLFSLGLNVANAASPTGLLPLGLNVPSHPRMGQGLAVWPSSHSPAPHVLVGLAMGQVEKSVGGISWAACYRF